ncbi:MAG: metallophosphoesterase [Thermoguttaceae bacterium]|nr:metallophosphoesterase [Thermoguttaceae bacterium]MDW8037383.1 metallophosphoesterase family protein [Thermoguttaceae bacterium]
MGISHAWLTLVGDVHSNMAEYLRLVKGSPYSIQLGDLGFDYSLLNQLDPTRHRFLPGNHDNYAALPPHSLGDFGLWRVPDADPEGVSGEIFFVRGAYSIDRSSRTENVDWFPQEELSEQEFVQVIELYSNVKPDFVISHDGPSSLLPYLATSGAATRTNRALQKMLDTHRPKYWFFAHHHFTWGKEINGTLFICLGQLAFLHMDQKLTLLGPPHGGINLYIS